MERRLSAILAADVVGYSRLMKQEEAGTFERLRAHRLELFEPEIEKHHGRVFKLMGDGLLAEFGSVVEAVECAVVLQRGMAERNSGVVEGRRIDVRIGVNLGDVIVEGEDRHGEGVNIAARLQQLAEPGGICVSQQAYDQVETKLNLAYKDLGQHLLKNIAKPVRVYRVDVAGAPTSRRRQAKYIEELKYGYNARPQPLERALPAAQKAIELDPQNQDGYYALAIIRYLSEKDFDSFHATAEQALALNPNNAWVVSDLGTWTQPYSGEWERGKALVRKAMALNPLHQRWLHFPFFLDHYRKGEYREARTVALKINLPENHMAQAGLAAVYGQLGETEKAKATLDHILTVHPKFADDPRAAFVKRRMPRELVESIMDGLRKAGLQVLPTGQ